MPVPSFIISVPPSQFHGTFQCLCSAVTEKNTIQSGDFYQFFCKIALRFIVVKIRDVNQLFSLLLNGLYNVGVAMAKVIHSRSEEHTSELQSRGHLVCRLLLEKKNIPTISS